MSRDPWEKPCRYPACPSYAASGGFCTDHAKNATPQHRQKQKDFYAATSWRSIRARVLAERPVCEICGEAWATEVHHRVKKTDGGTEEDDNLQALCKPCHSRLTAQGE